MKLLTIASLTLKEAARKRIILAGIVLTLLFLALYATGTHYMVADLNRSAQNGSIPGSAGNFRDFAKFQITLFFFMGLFMANIIGALVSVFAACGTISTEIDIGTLQTIAARPISRKQIVFGKWLGLATMLAIYMGTLFLLIVLIVYNQSGWVPNNIVPAGFILIGETLVILSATIFGSAFLSTIVNAVIVLMLYMTALIGGMMEQIGILVGKQALSTTGIVTGLLMPTDSLYRYSVHLLYPNESAVSAFGPPGSALGPFGSGLAPSLWVLIYAIFFTVILLVGAMSIFSKRDL